MQADFVLDYDVVKLNTAQKIYLMARVVSGEALHHQKRRPLNLSLVIDRSGSMAGDKIDYTRQAAQFLVQNLGVNDTLSIVLYNDTVETLLLPEKVQRKDAISQKIAEIKPSGTTNLSSGWLEGCKLVAQNLDNPSVNRVILMSDGLANRGVTDKTQLVTMAQQKFGEGVSTTTMGLGNDFNEDLMMEMASSGGGAFYFIESPEVTPQIFQEELQGLLNVVAQNLVIGVLPSDGVNIAGQLNAYAMKFDGLYTTFRLGDVFADEIKALVIELTLPPYEEGTHKIVNLRFEYDELRENNTTQHHVVELPVTIRATNQQNAIVVKNSVVNQNVLLLQAANARKTAVQLADRGAFNEASQILRNAAHLIENQNDDNPKLLEERNALMQQATDLEKGESGYDVYHRKTMSTQSFYTMNSRHEDTVMLRLREQQKKRQTQSMERVDSEEIENTPKIEKRPGVTPSHATWNGITFALKGDLIRIGRSSQNDIVMNVDGVSRFHCQLIRKDAQLYLEDLGSTNGTMMGGVNMDTPQNISVGDVAYVCDEKLIFHDGNYQAS